MNPLQKHTLKLLRRAYGILNPTTPNTHRNWQLFSVKQYASDLISKAILSPEPVMVARFGSTEMTCLTNFLGVRSPQQYRNSIAFIKGQIPAWWWEEHSISQMCIYSGFFPREEGKIIQFCELLNQDIRQIDILGSWLVAERHFSEPLKDAKRVVLEDLEPFFCERPWTWALEGKKVLVVHPFSETIQLQYKKREILFDNGLLPDFDLQTIKAVQSLAGEKTQFKDWFEALDHMKSEIEAKDFDVCIIGCGAYGMPLAAHVKRMGKKAIHLAGVTQLLFGIMGSRWESYFVYPYMNLLNEHWVRPGVAERPKNAEVVEGACYW
jgi:hypothetical protein